MDSVGTMIFSMLFVFVIGFIIYFTIDYLKYKEEIKKQMEQNDYKIRNLSTIDYSITSNLNMVDKSLTQKHNDDSSDLNAFDSALKNYFSFGDNNLSIQNEKLFEHVFSRISPNLELLTHVNTAQGLMINTNKEVMDSRNMKICNNEKNCIYMNVNDDGFNITPDSVNNLTINSTEKTPLAKFDLENNSIFFGGDDMNSPLFIQDDKVFVNNINMIVKPENTVYNHDDNIDDLQLIELNGVKINEMENKLKKQTLEIHNKLKTHLEKNETRYRQNMLQIISFIRKALTVIHKEYNKFIVFFNVTVRTSVSKLPNNKREFKRKIKMELHMISNYDYSKDDDLNFELPFFKSEDIQKILKTSMDENIIPSGNISLQNDVEKNKLRINLKLNQGLPSKTFVKFVLEGENIGSIITSTSGLLIGEKQA